MVVCCILSMYHYVLTFIIDFSGFHNGLKHLCSLKLVSILGATLSKVVMKCKLLSFLNFWALFLKIFIFEVKNFISPSIRYPINLIFSVVVCICKINALNGLNSTSNHTKFLDHVTLISWTFLKFSPVLGIIEIWKPRKH